MQRRIVVTPELEPEARRQIEAALSGRPEDLIVLTFEDEAVRPWRVDASDGHVFVDATCPDDALAEYRQTFGLMPGEVVEIRMATAADFTDLQLQVSSLQALLEQYQAGREPEPEPELMG